MTPSPELIERLRSDLAFHRAALAAQPDPRARKKAYRTFVDTCDALSRAVAQPLSPFRLAPGRTLDQIGLLLSISGFNQLLRIGEIWHIDGRALEDRSRYTAEARGDLGGSYLRAIDELTRHQRASVAVQAGPFLVQQLIAEIKRPVERLLALEPNRKGGRPRDVERRHVILEAQKVYEALARKRATKDEGGEFVTFCQDICVALDLETDTLGSLVAEVLHPRVRAKRTTSA